MSAATWRFHANLRSDMHVAALDMFPLAMPLRGSDALDEVQSVEGFSVLRNYIEFRVLGFRA